MHEFYDDGGEPESHIPSTEELTSEAPRCTDSANVDAIVLEHGRGYLYVTEWESWLAWDGKRWDGNGARSRVMNAAMLTARSEHYRTSVLLRETEDEYRKVLLSGQKDEDLELRIKGLVRALKWHEQSQNASRLEAAAKLLETRLGSSMRELDSDPWLFTVRNGTIDLRTADLRSHSPADRITHICDVDWDNDARCPAWETFVSQSMAGDIELRLYLQRLIGYSLTGLTVEHVLVFLFGEGNNGKSTFLQTVRLLLGEYACSAPRDLLFEDKSGQRHPTELARLYGKRMVVCAEIGEHVTLDEAKVKDLTGGDGISVRRMRENYWDLEPSHTLFVAGNHKPVVRGNDLGIWRRIRLVPWLVTVAADQIDKGLSRKLLSELPGILRWAVQGCLEWQRIGLETPSSVSVATSEYRDESDSLGPFVTGHLVFGRSERVSKQSVRERYEAWCSEIGTPPVGARRFAQRLAQHHVKGVTVREGSRTKSGWAGVRLKSDYERQVEAEPSSTEEVS